MLSPSSSSGSVFADVTGREWFADAVRWAASQEIVAGYGNGLLGPDDKITRAQAAQMLKNLMK